MSPEWLEWGSLGLLAMVLAAIGLVAREVLKGQRARDQERDEHLREVMRQDRADREKHRATLELLSRETIEANRDMANAVGAMCESLRIHEKRSGERHQSMIETIRVVNGKAAR